MTLSLTPTTTLICNIADYDAQDDYRFEILELGDGVRFRWHLEGCGDHGELHIGADALDRGAGPIRLSQGSVLVGETFLSGDHTATIATHTPPFLAPAMWWRRGRAGEPLEITLEGEVHLFEGQGTEMVPIEVDGATVSVRALSLVSEEGGKVLIQDDPTWPVLLLLDAGNDNPIALQRVETTRRSVDDEEALA
jgi:hypothetical protein